MHRFAVGALVLLGACWGSTAWAAGWSFALDLPVSYEFNDIHAVTTDSSGHQGSPLVWKDAKTSNVDGIIATLITPLHIGPVNFGLGYENYTVKGTLPIDITDNNNNSLGTVDLTIKSQFEILDLVLDIPTELFNIGAGYGMGKAKTVILVPDSLNAGNGSDTNIPTVPDANVNQYFLTLGVPIKRVDFHISWHWVNVDEVALQQNGGGGNSGPPQKILLSGQMLSLGARFNF